MVAARFSGPGQAYEGLAYRNESGAHWTGEIKFVEEHLLDPLRWKRPRRIFVNSMSDWAHERVRREYMDRMFAVMGLCYLIGKGHVFQGLTKRAERARDYLASYGAPIHVQGEMTIMADSLPAHVRAIVLSRLKTGGIASIEWPPRNFWHGVSVENQKTADERIPLLLQTPAAVRWVSAEPLLGPVDLRAIKWWPDRDHRVDVLRFGHWIDPTQIGVCGFVNHSDMHEMFGKPLDWIVVGGESGTGSRPFDIGWARSIKEQCEAAGVACFVKQFGANVWDGARGLSHKLRDRKGGDINEWPPDLRVREFPQPAAAPRGDREVEVSRALKRGDSFER